MIELRPYQIDMIDQTRALMTKGVKSILLQLPTGGGKTVLTADMLHSASQKGKRCFFLVHRRELIKQSVRTFVDVNVKHGVIASGFGERPADLVQIASVQTLARRYHKIIPPDMIVYDEAHHVAAGTWDKIYRAFPNAYHVGLTATPERLDGKGLRPWFKTMVNGPKIRSLIDNGYLSDYKIFAPTSIDTDGIKITAGEFNKKALNDMVSSKPQIVGDVVREYQRYANGLSVVGFAVSIENSKNTVAKLKAAGISAAHVDGDTDKDLRDFEIQKFKDGKTKFLSNVALFGEGFDVPGIHGISMFSPTNSVGLYLQEVGRALRPVYAPGYDIKTTEGRLAAIAAGPKPYAIILDHAGNVQRHGLPDDERDWNLDGKAGRRQSLTDGPGVKICPRCYAAQRSGPPKCGYCGNEFEINHREIEHVDGELKEMNLDSFRNQLEFDSDAERTFFGKPVQEERPKIEPKFYTMAQLKEIAHDRGLKRPDMWAKHVFNKQQLNKLKR